MNSHRSLPHHVVPLLALAVLAGCEEEIELPVYQLVPVTARDIVVSVSAAGTVEPIQTVEVKSKASGEIIDVLAETGDVVQRGSMLVRVDPRVPSNGLMQAEADIDVAEASLANAESQLRRAEALYETQSIAEQEFEAARLSRANANAQLVRAQRSLEDAKIAFEDTEVRAPATGVILERNVEVGTVISSATREVGGGSVLMKMANLDTVQVRTLVDETDIGKVQPQLEVTITVDAYPNQPFRGRVLKIEPQALEQQNVTMFPVLIRIANDRGILRPGMNAEVEIHVGERQRVLAIPNAALRTQRDIASAASVLGLDMEVVQQQLAAARSSTSDERRSSLGGATANGEAGAGEENTVTLRGQTVELPAGLTREQVQPIVDKFSQGGGPQAFQSLSSDEQAIMRRVMRAGGAGGGGGFGGQGGDGGFRRPGGEGGGEGFGERGAGGRGRRQVDNFQFGGNYIVFVMTETGPVAVPIQTGLTDLDYAEVVSGLDQDDDVLILPSASLVQSQRQMQERIERMTGGGGLPGVRSSRR